MSFSHPPAPAPAGARQRKRPRLPLRALLFVAIPLLAACDPGVEPAVAGHITIEPAEPLLEVGESMQLTATVLSTSGSILPGHPVSWSSSDEAVATVSAGGVVTGHAGGTTTIRARSDDQSATATATVAAGPCTADQAGTITAGQNRNGSLLASDCTFLHGTSADGYRLDLEATTGLSVELTSDAFDALLVVTDEHMNVLWWDDDGGDGLDSRLQQRIPAGRYYVWATGYGPGSTGAYRLSVTEVEIVPCPVTGDIAVGQTVTGALADSDCTGDRGFADPWRLDLASTTSLSIELSSDEFDAYLIIEDADGEILAWDDDSAGSWNARVQATLQAGEYRVVATSWGFGEIGAYTLAVRSSAASGAAPRAVEPGPRGKAPWLKPTGGD